MGTSMEMPKYKCHKEVHALQIKKVIMDTGGGGMIEFEDERYEPLGVSSGWMAKHNPKAGGYFVVYKDGYRSFSPQEAFEEGYTKV